MLPEQTSHTALLESLDKKDCDAYILNNGLWHLTNSAALAAFPQQAAALVRKLLTNGTERTATVLSRLWWRSTLLVELSRGVMNNKQIRALNKRMDSLMSREGIRVANYEGHFAGVGPLGAFTNDGKHPHHKVQVGILREFLAEIAAHLPAVPARQALAAKKESHL